MAAAQHHDKRPLSPGEQDSEERRKFATVGDANPVTIRCLMTFKQAGTVIGKGGATVAQLRKDTGCRITISDNLGLNQDRVLAATGDQEAVTKVLTIICEALAEVNPGQPLLIRLPIPNSQAGAVIGKQGSRIKEIRESTGAQINFEKEPLPGSTERLCTISGPLEVVINTIVQIVSIVAMASLLRKEQNVPFQPGMPAYAAPLPPHVAPHPSHLHPLHIYSHHPHHPPPHHLHPHQAPSPSQAFALPPSPYPPMQSELMSGSAQQTLYVPSEHAGALIGKGGSNIQHIRQSSGAMVKISPSAPGELQRAVTISGSFEACQYAARLIDMKIAEVTRALALEGQGGHPLGPLGMHMH